MSHDLFLREALAMAVPWQGQCAPNPSVGAVVVKAGRVIAKGWHEGAGSPHAEQMALHQVPREKDLTLYITLTPCNHWGRMPPCTDLIIQHGGVKQVVYAFVDPNPTVAKNDSEALLRAQGIEVLYHPLPEITAFYEAYAFWTKTHRPFVKAKLALSLDGKIAGEMGQPVALSNAKAFEFTHTQRAQCDVILTTARTIMQDNPALNVRLQGVERPKKIAILDRNLSLTYTERVFEKNSRFFIFYDARLSVKRPHPQCAYIPTGLLPLRAAKGRNDGSGLDLTAVLTALGGAGIHQVWVEAGGTLFTALHLQELVSRTYLYVTPHVLGQDALNAFQDKTVFQRQHSVSCNTLDDNVLFILDWK